MADRTDDTILRILEKDGRLSFNSLAEQIGLSKTPTWARVQNLERKKVITGYRAEIDPVAMGLELHAFVQVTITGSRYADFEAAVLRHPSILECYTTAGQGDYLLHVLVAGIAALDDLLRMDIARMPGVQRQTTTIGMKTIKRNASIVECGSYIGKKSPGGAFFKR
jgi:Lrp/AsnC family transcriptional regulator, leucine-responsive regulatory protein